jgi:16S rRNA (uracil1498-N3)-methyltransferase
MSSIPRVFVPPAAIVDGVVALPTEAAHHLRNVLRIRPGEAVTVHDGSGVAYLCVLMDGWRSREASARVESSGPTASEPRLRITIAQALPKTPDKIEQVLQHGTEIGAAGFVFWTARRSVARILDGEKVDKRLTRWNGIVLSAAEQSGRGMLPKVAWVSDGSALAQTFTGYNTVLVLHEAAAEPLRRALEGMPSDLARLLFIVGPEGGLTDDEIALFEKSGGKAITLGPRVLRTETAALVALAQVIYQDGD